MIRYSSFNYVALLHSLLANVSAPRSREWGTMTAVVRRRPPWWSWISMIEMRGCVLCEYCTEITSTWQNCSRAVFATCSMYHTCEIFTWCRYFMLSPSWVYASSHINPFTEKTILGASDERVGAHSLSRRQARIWVLPVPIMQEEVGEWKLMINTYQECKKCKVNVYLYKQKRLDERSVDSPIDTSKEHPQHLCGKCQKLGYYCRLTDII